jgi:hypothetical protein
MNAIDWLNIWWDEWIDRVINKYKSNGVIIKKKAQNISNLDW